MKIFNTMYLKEEFNKLTEDIKNSVKVWGEKKIDELCIDRPRLKSASVYLKRGLNNWLDREGAQVDRMVSTLTLFAADKEGNINTDTLIDDAVNIFREMDVNYATIGAFGIEYGKGVITITIPHNVLLDMIFANLGKVTITAEDLLELKILLNASDN